MCDYTEINDLNNQKLNHQELDSCTEIKKFDVKEPTVASTLSSVSDPAWHIEELKTERNRGCCGEHH
jgi:hypothetical protein